MDTPKSDTKWLLSPERITMHFRDKTLQIEATEVMSVVDACRQHAERYGIVDNYGREVNPTSLPWVK